MLPIQPFKKHYRRPDLRNHRKLVVVDGTVGFIGSQNLIVDHYHQKKNIQRGLHWKELMCRVEGPVVREIEAIFVTDWYSETDDLLLPGAGSVHLGEIDPAKLDCADGAQRPELRERQQPQAVRCADPERPPSGSASPARTTFPTSPSRWPW